MSQTPYEYGRPKDTVDHVRLVHLWNTINLPKARIAERMGISPSTVTKLLKTIRAIDPNRVAKGDALKRKG